MIPSICLKDVAPNFAKSINNFVNIAPIKASPGPVNTEPIPDTIPLANFEPTESPCNKSVIPVTALENNLKISLAASAKPTSPKTELSCCPPTIKLLIKASRVSFKELFFWSNFPAAPADFSKAFANWLCSWFKSSTKLIRMSLCLTPATFWIISPAASLFKPSSSNWAAKSLNKGTADLVLPSASNTAIPKSCKADRVSVLPNLAKIVLKALPMTAPPRWVLSWTVVIKPRSSSKDTPATRAEAEALSKPLIKSSVETANFVSTSASLSAMSATVRPAPSKPLIAAVNPATACWESIPATRTSFKAVSTLDKDSSTLKPWRANSKAPSATWSKDVAVFLATSNMPFPNCLSCLSVPPNITFILAKVASTLTVLDTRAPNAWESLFITATEAPKAKTRALDASKDFLNSVAWPVIFPSGLESLSRDLAPSPKFTPLACDLILAKAASTFLVTTGSNSTPTFTAI